MVFSIDIGYDAYSRHSIADRVDWIDAFDTMLVKDKYDSQIFKTFFRDLYHKETNNYIRQRAIECLCELTLLNSVRFGYTRDFLLDDAKTTGNTYIDITRVRHLFLLCGDDEECYQIFVEESQNHNPELASEACYRAGLVHLIYRVNRKETAQAILELSRAKKWFESAQQGMENRLDARFFGVTSDYLLSLLTLQTENADRHYKELIQLLWERQVWGYLSDSDLLEYRVLKSLSGMRKIVKSTLREPSWTDYKKELSFICNHFNELVIRGTPLDKLLSSSESFVENSVTTVLTEYYVNNLSACQTKIDAILADADPKDKALTGFLTSLSERLMDRREKKNDIPIGATAALCSAFKSVDPERIMQDVVRLKEGAKSDLETLSALTIRYGSELSISRINFLTGYKVGDEILKQMQVDLGSLLPSHPPNELAIFVSVLGDLIRYALQAETFPKEFFSHLYDPDVRLEEVFHKHLYTHLTSGERATNYRYEVSDAVGASRLDIMYIDQHIVFPIEVKKTDQRPSWESIKKDYVAQVQMYNRPYNRLGFLIVFDKSVKKGGKPLNDIRAMIQILSLSAFYSIPDKYPDYVVALIIPANRVSPSSYTKYT